MPAAYVTRMFYAVASLLITGLNVFMPHDAAAFFTRTPTASHIEAALRQAIQLEKQAAAFTVLSQQEELINAAEQPVFNPEPAELPIEIEEVAEGSVPAFAFLLAQE